MGHLLKKPVPSGESRENPTVKYDPLPIAGIRGFWDTRLDLQAFFVQIYLTIKRFFNNDRYYTNSFDRAVCRATT